MNNQQSTAKPFSWIKPALVSPFRGEAYLALGWAPDGTLHDLGTFPSKLWAQKMADGWKDSFTTPA